MSRVVSRLTHGTDLLGCLGSNLRYVLHITIVNFICLSMIVVSSIGFWPTTKEYLLNERMSSPSKRRDMDVMKLMMSDYTVEPINDGINEFNVEFHGPKESLYEGGVWKIHVELPDAYPQISFHWVSE
ncbi:hypothetical protein GH714_010823 [Hevea brasiliensis]|uniref:UBC core domain-containing protein n=1 Tax=Hevea brasiliensis TaxID=3981 RepID=A0A6A6M4L4_HEVBR|nr:hypothetical protein GH714_010823 [Hevea brasiliensis]